MITLTGFDTNRPAYIPEDYIDRIEEKNQRLQERDYPYSRIYIRDSKQAHDYFIDVVESKKYINKLVKQKQEEKSNGTKQ